MAKYEITRIYEVEAEDKQEALRVLYQSNWDMTYLSWQGIAELNAERKSCTTIAQEQWTAKPNGAKEYANLAVLMLTASGRRALFCSHFLLYTPSANSLEPSGRPSRP